MSGCLANVLSTLEVGVDGTGFASFQLRFASQHGTKYGFVIPGHNARQKSEIRMSKYETNSNFRNCLPVCSHKSRRLARRMVRFVARRDARQGQTPITSVESARWSQAGTNRDRGNPRSDSASADAPFAGTSSSRPKR